MAHLLRMMIGFGGGILGLALYLYVKPMWLGIGLFAAAFVVASYLAERIFRWLATPAELKADLEERARQEL